MSIAHTSGSLTGMPALIDDVASAVTKENVGQKSNRAIAAAKVSDLGREELERLVQRVFLSMNGDSPHSVVFAAVDDPNASAIVCARASQTLAAKTCKRVCIVEADSTKGDIYRLFKVEPPDTSTPTDDRVLRHCVQVRSNLWIASASAIGYPEGSSPDAEVVTQGMLEIRKEFDYVLINTPSAGSRCDAVVFGRLTDGLILVIEASSTRRKVAQTVSESIKAADVMLLGAVLHNRTYPIPAKLYHRL